MTTSETFLRYHDFVLKISKPPVLTNLDTFFELIALLYLNQKKFDGVKIGQFKLCIWSRFFWQYHYTKHIIDTLTKKDDSKF